MTRSIFLVVALLLAPASVCADAIGPEPTIEGCVRGSHSAVGNWMHHGQFAYCAPAVSGTDACREGFRYDVVELEIVARTTSGGGGHGAPSVPGPTLAEVRGVCDAPDDEAPLFAADSPLAGLGGGPTVEEIPAGCHRFLLAVADASVHCPPAPTPTPVPAAPAPAPTPVATPTAPNPSPTAGPLPTAPSSPTPTATPAAGCGCRASRRHPPFALVVLLAAAVARSRRRRG